MKIGMCIEVSAKAKAPDVAAALQRAGLDYISIGMRGSRTKRSSPTLRPGP